MSDAAALFLIVLVGVCIYLAHQFEKAFNKLSEEVGKLRQENELIKADLKRVADSHNALVELYNKFVADDGKHTNQQDETISKICMVLDRFRLIPAQKKETQQQ